MNKKLLSLIGGTLISGMLLVGCGANDDEQNPPPEDIDLNEDVNNGDRVEDDHIDTDLDMDNNDETLDNDGNNGTNGTNGTTGTDTNGTNGMNGTNGTTGTNGTNGTTGNGTNGTTGNGTTGNGTNGDADLLDDNDDNN
jgi:hypothetical protein